MLCTLFEKNLVKLWIWYSVELRLSGKLYADKGYISKKLFENLFEKGITLVTSIKKNMKNRLMPLFDKLLLRKRSVIETINDQPLNVHSSSDDLVGIR